MIMEFISPQVYGSIQDTRVVIQITGMPPTVGKGGAVTTRCCRHCGRRGGEQVQIAIGASTKSDRPKLPLASGAALGRS